VQLNEVEPLKKLQRPIPNLQPRSGDILLENRTNKNK